MMKQWLIARPKTPPWPPQLICMWPGSKALISVVLAGSSTTVSAIPLIIPGLGVEEGNLESIQSLSFPIRLNIPMCTPNLMLTA